MENHANILILLIYTSTIMALSPLNPFMQTTAFLGIWERRPSSDETSSFM